jgi:hypothetical protein
VISASRSPVGCLLTSLTNWGGLNLSLSTNFPILKQKNWNAAPNSLLADNHPAHQVARNLFRLSRLTGLSSDARVVRTKVEMAQQRSESADGEKDQNHRDRARALRALAEQAFSRSEPLDAREFPSAAVLALVKSETWRNIGDDRVTFRHDVLREWAIANLLFSDPGPVQ